MATAEKTEFKFWKDNKLDGEFALIISEIKAKYKTFLESKDVDWIKYYGHQTVNAFIGDKEGLNSTAENEDYDTLRSLLMETRHELIP